MISPDDIAEIVLEAVKECSTQALRRVSEPERKGKWGFHVREPYNKPYTSFAAKRIFLSEYEVKRLLSGGLKTLRIPKSAILSPLALEWMEGKNIEIVRE